MTEMTEARPPYKRQVERTAFAKGWRDGKKGVTPTPSRWPNAYAKGYWTAYGRYHTPPLPLKALADLDYAEVEARVAASLCVVSPQRHTADQYRCGGCGMIWDIDEPRPPCQITGSSKGDTK
jgi:hypothetical protein